MIVCLLCTVALFLTMPVAGASEEERPATGTATIGEDQYLRLLSRVENLEKRDQDQQAEINTLRSELNTEKQRTSVLEAKLSWLTVNYGKCRKTAAVRKHADPLAFRKQESEAIHTKEQVRNTRSDKDADEIPSRIKRQTHAHVVAFLATLANHAQHTGVHQSIAFDNVVTNIGGAYNPHYGSFTAPVSGVYVFSTTLLGQSNSELHCSIVRNGSSVVLLYMRDRETVLASDSAMVVLHLNKGDDVDVQNEDTDKFIHGGHYSMFSGFLLHEDQPSESIIGK